MPAYAMDGKVVGFVQSTQKFTGRYATLVFSDPANPRPKGSRAGHARAPNERGDRLGADRCAPQRRVDYFVRERIDEPCSVPDQDVAPLVRWIAGSWKRKSIAAHVLEVFRDRGSATARVAADVRAGAVPPSSSRRRRR